ncbi:MAG: lipase maturation factor family protein [Roseivirga sp.]|nr:lipase maturation factor family protein [Roseivirga sp.]
MKLAHYQLAHITDYINAQNICYTDIRHELTDHIASAVEHKITEEGLSFAEAFSDSIEQVDCTAIQRNKLINETLALWKTMGRNAIDLLNGYRLLMLMLIACATSLTYFSGMSAENLENWFSTGINVLIMIPVIACLLDRKLKPYKQSYFMSSVVGLYLMVQIIISLKTFVFDNLIDSSLIIQTIFFSIVLFVISLGFQLISKSYLRVKNYTVS